MQPISDAQASGGQSIKTAVADSGTATYDFNVETGGLYEIIARVYAFGPGSDSFFVKIDNEEEDTWDLNPEGLPEDYNIWREDEVTKRGTGTFNNPQHDPYIVELSQGQHTITFRGRESETGLDYFRNVRVGEY